MHTCIVQKAAITQLVNNLVFCRRENNMSEEDIKKLMEDLFKDISTRVLNAK